MLRTGNAPGPTSSLSTRHDARQLVSLSVPWDTNSQLLPVSGNEKGEDVSYSHRTLLRGHTSSLPQVEASAAARDKRSSEAAHACNQSFGIRDLLCKPQQAGIMGQPLTISEPHVNLVWLDFSSFFSCSCSAAKLLKTC